MPSPSPSVAFRSAPLLRRLGGLVGWLRGGVGITASGGFVESWADPYTGLSAAKVSDGTRPTDSTLGGVRCPLFVDTSSTELRTDLAAITSGTILCVQKFAAGDLTQGTFRLGTSGDVLQGYGFHDPTGTSVYFQSFGPTPRTISGAGGLDVTKVHAYVFGSGRTAIFSNGTKLAEAGADTLSAAKLRIGSIGVASYFHKGYIVDFVLYNRDLGDTAIVAASAYLGALRGVY